MGTTFDTADEMSFAQLICIMCKCDVSAFFSGTGAPSDKDLLWQGKRRGLTVTISDYGAGGPRFKSRRRRFDLFSEFKLFGRYHHIELAQREASAKATTQTDGGKSSL